MKGKVTMERDFRKETGITLIALIITVIILVILAAVSIRAVYNMGIVGRAVNGTQDYARAAKAEEDMFGKVENLLSDTLGNLKEKNIDDKTTNDTDDKIGIDSYYEKDKISEGLYGLGTESEPFRIYTASDLVYMENAVNETNNIYSLTDKEMHEEVALTSYYIIHQFII